MRKVGITDEQIVGMYLRNKTYHEMREITGLTDRGIRGVLYKHNIEKRKPRRLHFFDEHYFGKWSHEMAWVLGMLVTDGCVSGSTVNFSQKDKSILEKIKRIMGLDYKIKGDIRGVYTLSIGSRKMVEQLKKIGVTEKKSLIVPFPNTPKEYLPSFIRGVIDGDGWVHKKGYVVNVTTGSLSFAIGLKKAFESYGLPSEIDDRYEAENPIYRVWVRGKEHVVRLAEILYENDDGNCVVHKKERMHFWLNEEKQNVPKNKKLITKKEKKYTYHEKNGHLVVLVVSKQSLKQLKQLSELESASIETLLLKGFEAIKNEENFTLDKEKHPSDKTRLDIQLHTNGIQEMKKYAKTNQLSFYDLLEEAVLYINKKVVA